MGSAERRAKRGKQLVCFARSQGLQVAAIKGFRPELRLYHRLVMRCGSSMYFITARDLGHRCLLETYPTGRSDTLKGLMYPTFRQYLRAPPIRPTLSQPSPSLLPHSRGPRPLCLCRASFGCSSQQDSFDPVTEESPKVRISGSKPRGTALFARAHGIEIHSNRSGDSAVSPPSRPQLPCRWPSLDTCLIRAHLSRVMCLAQ